jgi:hypothetical protein
MATTRRYVKELMRLIERYGEDVSLSQALQLESNPKSGRPPRPMKAAEQIYMLVELAIDAGYKVKTACRLLDDFFGLKLGEDWVRNRYYAAEKIYAPLIKKHRVHVLEWYAAKFPDWVKRVRNRVETTLE